MGVGHAPISPPATVMSDNGVKRIADALKCLSLLLELIRELFPEWAATLEDLEDEIIDYMQELR